MGGWIEREGKMEENGVVPLCDLSVLVLILQPNRGLCAAAECETGRRAKSHKQLCTKRRAA